MPTVLRKNGFDFKINTEDHEPMHVHVWKQGAVILINLGDAATRVSVRENKGMNRSEERRALRVAGEHQEFLQKKWKEIYG